MSKSSIALCMVIGVVAVATAFRPARKAASRRSAEKSGSLQAATIGAHRESRVDSSSARGFSNPSLSMAGELERLLANRDAEADRIEDEFLDASGGRLSEVDQLRLEAELARLDERTDLAIAAVLPPADRLRYQRQRSEGIIPGAQPNR